MSCGLKRKLGEGAEGGGPLPPSPKPPPPTPYGGLGGEFEGRAGELPSPGPPLNAQPGQERAGTTGPWPSPHDNSVVVGLDFGSRFVKLVYNRDGGSIGRRRVDSITFYRDYLRRDSGRLFLNWPRLNIAPPAALVATGYGKNLLQHHFPTITEIRAHFLGARFVTGLEHFILLEAGGQDTKVIYVKNGRVFDFLTNDRCAAGTGRYLENMARALKMPLTAFAACAHEPVEISQTCAIFGESELVGHLLAGLDPVKIAAGVNTSVARRVLAMVRRYPCPTLILAGGVAKNRAVVKFIQDQELFRVLVPPQPQFIGALGCFLEAARQVEPGLPA